MKGVSSSAMPRTVGSAMWWENPVVHAGVEHGVSGVDAHAAGVGAGVALADAFVVLGGNERGYVFTVRKAEEADFVALKGTPR